MSFNSFTSEAMEAPNKPTDTVSCLRFCDIPNLGTILAASSWDGLVIFIDFFRVFYLTKQFYNFSRDTCNLLRIFIFGLIFGNLSLL